MDDKLYDLFRASSYYEITDKHTKMLMSGPNSVVFIFCTDKIHFRDILQTNIQIQLSGGDGKNQLDIIVMVPHRRGLAISVSWSLKREM